MEQANIILIIGLIVFLAHLFFAIFQKTRIPDVLTLVILGLCLGPFSGWIKAETFGQFGNLLTTVALVIILFETGLELDFSNIKGSFVKSLKLALYSFVGVILVVFAVSQAFLSLPILETLILSSAVAATSAPIVSSIVNRLPITDLTKTSLILDSTLSDVICILSCLGFLEVLSQKVELKAGFMIGKIIASFLLAALIGGATGFIWSIILSKARRLQNSSFMTPAFVFVVFGLTEMLGYSGIVSSLAFGIILNNIHRFYIPNLQKFTSLKPITLNQFERNFLAEIVFLIRTFFFIYLGLSIKLNDWMTIILGSFIVLGTLLIRLFSVKLSLNKSFSSFDSSIASVMIPKGLATAALATLISSAPLENLSTIQELIYAVILFSILATTILSFLIEKTALRNFYAMFFKDNSSEQSKI